MSYPNPRSAPTSPGHHPPPPSSQSSSTANNSSSQQQRQNSSTTQNPRRNSKGSFWTSGGGGGGSRGGPGGGSFDINQFTQNISNSLQDIFSTNLLNGEPLMDLRKMLNKTCNSCGTSFSIFQRKKRCHACSLHFCHACMELVATQRGVYRCRRCLVFAEMPLTKDALNTLRVRDLKWYLTDRNINVDTYSEKRELIELIIAHVHPPPPPPPRPAQAPPSFSRRGSSASVGSHQSQPQARTEDNNHNNNNANRSQPSSNSSSQPPTPSHHQQSQPQQSNVQESSSWSNLASQEQQETNQLPRPSALDPSRSAFAKTGSLSQSNLNISTFNLTDIKNESEIKDLSVRQLKLILTRNFVDFKGCVEREELIAKAVLLYQDHKLSAKFKDENEDNVMIDENVCKICMENPIDCVLLECGHMLTCTACGKCLPECPVCRQFVSRVVHVFKG